MERMKLEDFRAKYYPKLSQGQLGKLMGVSNSEYSKIKTQVMPHTSLAFKRCADWMRYMHNVILTYDSPNYAAEQKYKKMYESIIRQKDKRIMELEEEVRSLKAELAFRDDFAKCIKYIKRNC